MIDYVKYDSTTGAIISYGTCHPDAVSLQATEPNHAVLQATYQPGTVVNGALVPMSTADVQAAFVADRKAVYQALIAQKKKTATP
jgi:hypothetical protein